MTFLPPPGDGNAGGGGSGDCDQLKRDLQNLENSLALFQNKLNSTPGPDGPGTQRGSLSHVISLLNDEIATTETRLRDCLSPVGPPPFKVDPWELVSPFGIVNQTNQTWTTGSIWTVLPLDQQRLLVGTENGGLWLSEPDGSGGYKSTCLSNAWKHYSVRAMVADPKEPNRIFVGCFGGGLYVGDVSPGSTLYPDWAEEIPIPSWMSAADVYSMIILAGSRLLVLGTNSGLAWSSIDSSSFAWQGETDLAISDITNLESDKFLFASAAGISVASINQGSVVTAPVPANAIQWAKAPTSFSPSRLASCKTQPRHVYCAGTYAGGSTTRGLFIIRSADNGSSWHECQYGGSFGTLAGDLSVVLNLADPNDIVKSRMGVSVHSTRPAVVAIGYKTAAISVDSGDTWDATIYGGHDDVHEILFDSQSDVVHIPNDGGLMSISRWENRATAQKDTLRNKTLPVVMLYTPENWRTFYGNLSVSDEVGFISAGSQDNANLWCTPGSPWMVGPAGTTSGDGGAVAVGYAGKTAILISSLNSNSVPAIWATWENGSWKNHGTIPIRLSDKALDSKGLIPLIRPVSSQNPVLIYMSVDESIGFRKFLIRVGPIPILALAYHLNPGRNVIYGAAYNSISKQVEWIELGRISPLEEINALEPYSSYQVIAGTVSGRLFVVNVGGTFTEIPFPQDNVPGPVGGIASSGGSILVFRGNGGNVLYYRYAENAPLKQIPASIFPPNGRQSQFGGIAINRNPVFQRFNYAIAVYDNEVWVSNSPTASVWHKIVDGLPLAVRSADVAFSNSAQQGELFLSTYGRGVYRLTF